MFAHANTPLTERALRGQREESVTGLAFNTKSWQKCKQNSINDQSELYNRVGTVRNSLVTSYLALYDLYICILQTSIGLQAVCNSCCNAKK